LIARYLFFFKRRFLMIVLRRYTLMVLSTVALLALVGCANSLKSAQSYVQLDWGRKSYVKGDKTSAAAYYEKAAQKGSAEAQFLFGRMLIYGDGIGKDTTAGIGWLEKASAAGYAPAQAALGPMYYIGADGLPQDAGKAVSLLEGAARQDDLSAMLMLGMVYTLNVGVTADPSKAAHWLKRASEKGAGIGVQWTDPHYLAKLYPNKVERFDPVRLSALRTKDAQSRLKKLGYDPGPADGLSGKRTTQAVKDFQLSQGMEADGTIDSALLWHLLATNQTATN
jgi:TPR repeat protein